MALLFIPSPRPPTPQNSWQTIFAIEPLECLTCEKCCAAHFWTHDARLYTHRSSTQLLSPQTTLKPSPTSSIKMRKVSTTFAVAALAGASGSLAFAPPSSQLRPVNTRSSATLKMVYIPDGLSAAEWKKIKDAEKKKKENLGKMGPSRFKSRSFQVSRVQHSRARMTHDVYSNNFHTRWYFPKIAEDSETLKNVSSSK